MAEQEQDTLYVIAAAYDDVDAAVADYEAVTELFGALRTSHDFDAAVIAKDESGTVRIVAQQEHPARHGAVVGLSWRPARGIVETLFSPAGIPDAGGAGAAIGGVAGRVSGGTSRGDLQDLGEALDEGRAGLVALLRRTRPIRWRRTARPPTPSSPGSPIWPPTSWPPRSGRPRRSRWLRSHSGPPAQRWHPRP
jgi:uncharacterized membrane protein